jgi:hypothetical protein
MKKTLPFTVSLRNFRVMLAAAAALLALVMPSVASAAICSSTANGVWTAAIWGAACPAGGPTAADDVTINLAHLITFPAGAGAYAARSLTFSTAGGTARLTQAASQSLTIGVGGVTIIGSNTNNGTKSWNINAGTATVNGAVALNQGSTVARTTSIQLSSGSLDINGNLTMTNTVGAAATAITMNTAPQTATLFIAGSFTLSNGLGTLTSGTGSTVTYDTAAAATVATGSAISYRNLTINKPGATATGAATGSLTVLGTLTVTAGTLSVSNAVAVTGATSVSGTFSNTTATGTKTFTGNVTINPGGTFRNDTVAAAVAMGGSLTNNGTFTSGTGTYTFTGNANWAGSNALTFSGSVVANANTRTNAMTGVATTIVGNLSGTGTVANAINRTLRIGGNATITGLTGVAPNTIEYNGAGAQTGKAGGTAQYSNLIINSGGIVSFAGSFRINGDLTNNGNFSHTGAANTVTFNGTIAQNLKKTGTATNTTFVRLALNNTAAVATRQLILDHNVTVTTLLTLTAGRITTGAANSVYVSNGSAIASPGGNDFVEGNLRKPYAGAALSRVFEVGNYNGTSKYTPATLAFAAVSVAGDVTVSTTNANHPQFASSGLDVANHVNRYWVVANSGVTFTTYTLTLTYIAGAPAAGDIDAAATAAAFVATRYDGANWNATTLNAIPSTTQIVLIGVTAVGDFAVGEVLGYNAETPASSGRFNAYDAVAGASVQGYIRTKTAGNAFTLRIVHLTAAVIANLGTAGTITVSVIDASSPTGAFNTSTNCYSSWASATAITSVTIAAAANQNTWTTPAITVPNSYKNLRIRVSIPLAPVQTGCSSDAFAIIPSSFGVTVSDGTSSTTGTRPLIETAFDGTAVHKAGLPFSVRVNSAVPATATNYYQIVANAGSPALKTATCVNPTGGSPACTTCITGNLALGAFSVVSSELNSTATYDEAGVFDLTFQDTAYAAVDVADTALASRTIPQTLVFRVGRFIPNDLLLTVFPGNTPQFQTFGVPDASCNASAPAPKRSFTYVGQSFKYIAGNEPKVLVTARNGLGSPTATRNYQQCLWRLAASDVARTPSTSNAGKTLNSSPSSPAVVSLDDNSGTGTVTLSSSDSFSFSRSATTPDSPFNAIVNIAVSATDADGVASNTLDFSSIGFDGGGASSGTEMRYGRLKLLNAYGSDLLPLRVPVRAEYFNGATWTLNTADNCTNLLANAFNPVPLAPFAGTGVAASAVALSSGNGTLTLSKPSPTAAGSIDVAVNLGTSGSDQSCLGSHGGAAANMPWLQGNWCGVAGYVRDPNARIKFGSPKAPYIYLRERY